MFTRFVTSLAVLGLALIGSNALASDNTEVENLDKNREALKFNEADALQVLANINVQSHDSSPIAKGTAAKA